MKKILVLSLLLSIAINITAQTSQVDSLKAQLNKTQPDSSTIKVLESLINYYQDSKADSLLFYAKQELALAIHSNNTKKMAGAYESLGQHEYIAGNYPIALQMLFKSLQLAESINDSSLMVDVYIYLGNAYKEYDAPDKAKRYYLQCKILAEKIHYDWQTMFADMNLGQVYYSMNRIDSAMFYEQQAYTMSIKSPTRWVGLMLITLADIQSKLNNKNLALEYYKMGIESYKINFGTSRNLSKGYLALAAFYKKYGINDSAIHFAHLSMNVAKEVPYLKGISKAGIFLSDLYDSLHRADSAFFYMKVFVSTNDTLNSRNRTADVENLTMLEGIRQQEREQSLTKVKEERKLNIQYALLALGILTFVIVFLLLSRSFITNIKLIKFFLVIALLMVFEFIDLYMHPFLETITHQSPLLMLLALVCIAALLVPMHYRLEKWAANKLVEKNKQIRLSAAKKTIEQLEKGQTN